MFAFRCIQLHNNPYMLITLPPKVPVLFWSKKMLVTTEKFTRQRHYPFPPIRTRKTLVMQMYANPPKNNHD